MKKASLQIFTAILALGLLFCGTASAVPSIVAPAENATVQGIVDELKTFSIQTNESTTIEWLVSGSSVSETSYDAGTNTSYLEHTVQTGPYNIIATVQSTGESRTWTIENTQLEITSTSPEKDKSTGINESQEFRVETNKVADITWYMNGVLVDSATGVTSETYQNVSSSAATHNVTVIAQNGTETASYQWTWTVGSSSANEVPVKVDPLNDKEVEISEGTSQIFYVNSTNSQNIKVDWIVGNDTKKTEENVISSSYKFNGDTSGNYTLKAVISDPSGTYTSLTETWTVKVQSKYYLSGNRIWDEDLGLSTTYTWNAQSYSGFYYDLDTGESSEEMTITGIGRNIDDGDIEYITKPTETAFEYGSWGSYQIIGFMAEKYFAGYSKTNSTVIGEDVSLISDGVLSKILIDSDDKESAYSGDSFELEDGYALNIVEVDINGKSVWVQLEKDGDVVDDDFITSDSNYIYETEVGESEDVPIIIVHFGTVFAGAETSAVFIQGIFQVSDTYIELTKDDSYGEMEVTSISSSEIRMKNEDDISLDKGDTIDLMGKIQIQVADDSKLRFAPVLDTSEEGIYELRGTVYDKDVDGDSLPTWTPYNFEGFYYNIDEGIGTEKLEIQQLDGREIPSGKLVYTSTPQPVQFEHKAWGNFTVVGFMAEKYFAGYPDNTVNGEIDGVSLLSDNVLSKVLTDSDDKESMYSGSALVLEDGYSLNILEVDINGESVWVQLEKDGKVVDDEFITSNDDYIYETEVGEAEDVPIIIVHFGTVFAGTETSAVFTQGIFQISDDYIEINNGDTFDEMEISSVSSENGITMKNDDGIGLDDDETIDIMGDVKFKTADSNTLRFYPFVEVETASGESRELKINLPDEIIVGDTFDIEVTAGENPIEGITVKVNSTSTGKTNADGIVEYTAEKEGTFKVTAEKDGYTTANKNMKVIPPKEKMSLNISPETVYVGDEITIEALKTIGGDPIEGANVSINSKALGKTGSDGKITYTAEEVGKLKISATGGGFLDKSVEVNVKDYEAVFEFSNLVIDPIEVRAGKEATITIDAENTGNAAGEYDVELFVNGSSVDSQQISLDVGESTTVTFEHSEEVPGTYTVKVGGQEATYTVKEKSSMLLYALLTIILLLGGGMAYMFTKGGWTVATLQAKMNELVKSANLKK
ncbi:S-layer protein domain-containing protein [Methanosarcina sp.]|uniref:S-layer protein domain-containing protein n=1 Tax=Methanosarcina sp. TaxID=2213 RepID=UPI002ABCB08E|nr:S-layer protein domain-containing protein [Methanosarcina sp.]MDY9927327.1 S-layer protein domain-containing protein [Methanosarcina sp.]